jgi:hypothetical protein
MPRIGETPTSRRSVLGGLGAIGVATVGGVTAALNTTPTNAEPASGEDDEYLGWAVLDYRKSLNRDHTDDSCANVGERTACMLNAKTKSEITHFVTGLSDEDAETVVNALVDTHENLRVRLALIACALNRLEASSSETV